MMSLTAVPIHRPAAPYPAQTKSNGFQQQVDIERVCRSKTWLMADNEVRPWLWQVWLLSWSNIPAGSWEDDDELICATIGCKPEWFAGHREQIMRGWRLHADGRLYHPFITEQVLDMIERRRKSTERQRRMRGEGTDESLSRVTNAQSRVTNATSTVTYAQDVDVDVDKDLYSVSLRSTETPAFPVEADPKRERIPYEAIRKLFIEVLPTATRPLGVEHWTEARKGQIRARWLDQLPDLDTWRKTFERCKRSDFLMGKASPMPGRPPFKLDLFWITKPENLLKLYEGRYENAGGRSRG